MVGEEEEVEELEAVEVDVDDELEETVVGVEVVLDALVELVLVALAEVVFDDEDVVVRVVDVEELDSVSA